MNRFRALVLALLVAAGSVTVATPASAAPAKATSAASAQSAAKAKAAKEAKAKANLIKWINVVDPKRTVKWTIKSGYILGNHDGVAIPWENRIELSTIYVGDNDSWAKYMVLHEWSHILQYRAYGGKWGYATMNAGLLMPGTPGATAIEHEADCVYYALGGKTVTRGMYGCPNNPALQALARRIAAKQNLLRPQGTIDKAPLKGRTLTVQGWVGDPTVVNAQTAYKIAVDGRQVVSGTANQVRSDVNKRNGYVGKRGFTAKVALNPGVRRVCLSSVAWDNSGSVTVKCETLRVK